MIIVSLNLFAVKPIEKGEMNNLGTSLSPNRNKAYIKESKMKLTVLVDNNTLIDRYFFAEPGISLYIE